MAEEQYDVIIVGAGFSGISQLNELRQLGLRCIIIEAGSDLGGVWYWNRYPGARVDSPIPYYAFPLPDVWKEWTWTEVFPNRQELLAYFTYVGDKLNLRPHCRFDTVVKQAHWDDQSHIWRVTAEGKEGSYDASARYLILCLGFAAKPYIPNFKGRGTFKGPCCHTNRWPKEGIETSGKRVGIIGTGASGLQVIQEIGPEVAHLTVFQRTPNLALPMGQCSISKRVQDNFKPVYEELYQKLNTTSHGLPFQSIPRPLSADSDEVREANLERLWDLGGFNFTLSNYPDIFRIKASNDVVYAFWRRKVSERIKDPKKCTLLAPVVAPHPLAAKRPCPEERYYEVLSQENVDIVDTKASPIMEIYEHGVKTLDKAYEFDVLILATGFDVYGGYTNIDLRGLNGETIQDHWKDSVRAYLGLTIDNFPNLFCVGGPQAPTAFTNAPVLVHLQSVWVAQTMAYLRERHITKFTPTTDAALTFQKHVNELADATLLPQAPGGWYMSGNIPGRKPQVHSYAGGLVAYRKEIMAEIEGEYPGFLRDVKNTPYRKGTNIM